MNGLFIGVFIDKINELGTKIRDILLGYLYQLPGFLQGIVSVIIVFLAIIGLLQIFKKSIGAAITIAAILAIVLVLWLFVFK
jgi:small-conductance mechanosensitive channel